MSKKTLANVAHGFEPGPDRMVQSGKPQAALWEKSRDLCELRSDLTILRSVIRPLLTVPYFPLNLNLKKGKKKRESFKFCSLQSTSHNSLSLETLLLGEASFKFYHCHLQHHSFKFWLCSPPVMCVWQGESMREREWERERERKIKAKRSQRTRCVEEEF